MRGKLGEQTLPQRLVRIIPAHAGQTQNRYRLAWRVPDHPRACGANWRRRSRTPRPLGSSPRMRGKLLQNSAPCKQRRIIPAHAGQTTVHSVLTNCQPDHPRACGANAMDKAKAASMTGSSPRMRGKPKPGELIAVEKRIIPAHAGQTEWSWPIRIPAPDHPRACGANDPVDAM